MRALLTDRNLRRVITLGVFLGLLYLFRHLALLLVFFVLFERSLGAGAGFLHRRLRVPVAVGVLGQIVLALGALTGLGVLGYTAIVPAAPDIVRELQGQATHFQHWLHARGWDHLLRGHTTSVVEGAQHYAGQVFSTLGGVGKKAIYVLIGLILAVVFLLEGKQLSDWRESLPEDGMVRTVLRYLGYVCDAISITAQLQVIVALVNTLITLPVLLLMGMPSIPALMVLLFVSGLVPVVGGVVSGVVMAILAFTHKGLGGVAVFFISTFFLHKIESYYLSPRLTARHVKLPGFLIVTALILFEHVFGLVGLFLSFPSLYVAAKILEGWRHESSAHEDEMRSVAQMRMEKPS
jgi:predicted PurR-regulated permease PerM